MLELTNISFNVDSDDGKNEIIRDLSLTVKDNKFIVITGPNGGGKSTLAKIIAGIVKNTDGRIIFDGEDITDKSITERAKMGIGFAFQQPVRFKGLTVHDLLRIASNKELSIS
ncbi:MAG: ATP-binding cassette domain-containing protein, partial [Ruminococcus flavefaciens]